MESLRDIMISVMSIILALLIGGIIIYIMGESPFVAFSVLFAGVFSSVHTLANTVSKAIPIVFTGLAVGLAFRCGLFNIGAEGQLYIGAFFSVITAIYLKNLPGYILLPLTIMGGFAAGMIWGGIPGFLKARFSTHEVIVTVMLNYVAIFLTSYMVNYPFKAEGWVAQTEVVPKGVILDRIIPRTQLTSALYIAVAVIFIVYFFLWKTSKGYEIRAVGENPYAAESGGINIAKNITLAMALSGGLAALGGITQVLGVHQRFIDNFSPGYGFTGIAVAVLGRNHPVGITLAALLFGALDTGALRLDRVTNISADMVVLIQGLVILFVAAPEIVSGLLKKGVSPNEVL